MTLKKILVYTFSFCTFLVLISANSGTKTKEKINQEAAMKALETAQKDGNVSYKELLSVAEIAKGEKLTLKEKLALKFYNKKMKKASGEAAGGKSQLIALLLVLFVGVIGIHRFYLGYTWQGIVQLLTLGGCGIWTLIDTIRIITGDLTPKDGDYETTL